VRDDLAALLGGIAPSRYEALRLRLEALDAKLPALAGMCAESAWWRGGPSSRCIFAVAYREALVEYDATARELVSIGAFLAA
jgi:hypothetical protein